MSGDKSTYMLTAQSFDNGTKNERKKIMDAS